MNRTPTAVRIEQAIEERAGLVLSVEEDGDVILVSGIVGSEAERQAALEIANEFARDGLHVEESVAVTEEMPEVAGGHVLAGTEIHGFRGAAPGTAEAESLVPGDFTDRETLAWGDAAAGPGSALDDDLVSEGDHVFVPPTDPVVDGDEVVGGLQRSSMDSIEVERSSDGTLGDEAIRDAVIRELREDAMTHALEIEVNVDGGLVRLRGRVADLDDAEAAEEVAARVPGVVDVREDLEVESLEERG